MQNVIAADASNAETLAAFKEVEQMKADNSIGRDYARPLKLWQMNHKKGRKSVRQGRRTTPYPCIIA